MKADCLVYKACLLLSSFKPNVRSVLVHVEEFQIIQICDYSAMHILLCYI